MIELILGEKLEPNHLQKILERTNVSRLGLQYIKKNRNEILLIYQIAPYPPCLSSNLMCRNAQLKIALDLSMG